MIERIKSKKVSDILNNESKVIVIYGARQVGKTTMIQDIISNSDYDFIVINADELKYHEVFSERDLSAMESVIDRHEAIFIDEAQRIKNIGINLKILHDARPDLKIIVSGSSSLDLADHIREPLTGRTRTLKLYPLSIQEIRPQLSPFELNIKLDEFLSFGLYPEVFTSSNRSGKIEHLEELTRSYLFKDIFQIANIRHSSKFYKLLQLLALQIGSTVSINKLANALDLSSETVNSYIDLLELAFVVFRRSGYSNNPAKEISKMDKIYFYDLGLRNAIIQNFSPLELRQDKGQLWENFIVSERLKFLENAGSSTSSYFWRTYGGTEIDIVEKSGMRISGLEIKWTVQKKKAPKLWKEVYPQAEYQLIHKDNWLSYVLDEQPA